MVVVLAVILGGSWSGQASGGGGATHISTKSGLLQTLAQNKSDILMVAGGGGGFSLQASNIGGYGGGANGETRNWFWT